MTETPLKRRTAALSEDRIIEFVEYGPHKTLKVLSGPAAGMVRVSDQETIDALREAFEATGWKVVDRVC